MSLFAMLLIIVVGTFAVLLFIGVQNPVWLVPALVVAAPLAVGVALAFVKAWQIPVELWRL